MAVTTVRITREQPSTNAWFKIGSAVMMGGAVGGN
jgi:hypothetical protein